ncbi:hypothetical protein J0H58_29790 [bacterium]|nr:hypothetical protein [bacterium]
MPPTQLPFPFWLLIHRGASPWRPVLLPSGRATAFSTHRLAGEFLARESCPGWEVRLVVRPTLMVLLEEFRRQGVTGITLDPGDGGGVAFPFTGDS